MNIKQKLQEYAFTKSEDNIQLIDMLINEDNSIEVIRKINKQIKKNNFIIRFIDFVFGVEQDNEDSF